MLSPKVYHHKGDDVDDFDHRVNGGTRGVFVWVADRVPGHRRFMSMTALAVVAAILDMLFGIVPGTPSRSHGYGNKETGDNASHQESAECDWAEQ